MKLRASSLGRDTKLTNLYQTHQEKERTQINIIRNEKGEITADTTDMERIIRDY